MAPAPLPGADGQLEYHVSKEELVQLSLALQALPAPPIPVCLEVGSTEALAPNQRKAFNVATSQLLADMGTECKYVSSHNAIGALLLFWRWSGRMRTEEHKATLVRKKEKLVLDMTKAFLDEKCREGGACDGEFSLATFQALTRGWIEAHVPPEVSVKVWFPEKPAVEFESPLHVAVAGYCYAQGVFYSAGGPKLACEVHRRIEADYQSKVVQEAAGEEQGLDPEAVRSPEMEMSRLYSHSPFEALAALCGARILNDAVHGFHRTEADASADTSVEECARLLVEASISEFRRRHAGTAEAGEVVRAADGGL